MLIAPYGESEASFSAPHKDYSTIKFMMRTRLNFIFFQLFATVCCQATRPKKYISSMTANGMIYHIPSLKIPKANKSQAKKQLSYDITYLASEDTLSFTSTVISNVPFKTDSVCFNRKYYATEMYFVERKKKRYYSRINVRIPYKEYLQLLLEEKPLSIDYGNHMTLLSIRKNGIQKRMKFWRSFI